MIIKHHLSMSRISFLKALVAATLIATAAMPALAQPAADDIYVCFYAAPMEKAMQIMHDVYHGIAHSTDGGATWESMAYKTSLMNDIAIHPETGDLFVASEYGVLRSEDNGDSWKQLTGWEIQTVFNVAFYGNAVWIAAPEGPHVSHDNGATWKIVDTGLEGLNSTYTGDISSDGESLLIATADGIYRLAEDGTSWLRSGLENIRIDKLERHPSNAHIIAAINLGRGIWISSDNGATWDRRNGDLYSTKVQAVAFHPSDPLTMYSGMSDYPVCKTTDGGKTWKTVNRGLTINSISALAVDPNNPDTVYAGTENGLWVSNNGGEEWQNSPVRFGYIRAIRFGGTR